MDVVNVTNWFDVFICVVVLYGIFGILALLIHQYGAKGHH
jgi:hypothetical protein